ncbi:CopD family protein [Paralcaligenes ureilyticus]|uniref:Putative membrane protein n=1 Tax=Paralcaligenes ureilyticus TaxID=627131 RepID=A0A4R3LYG5_9BURK|nr:CopD family protein [Paralcaligenes ureilyticus]TCT04879.1 putative membrane protein [Paralcaligenes ureilyticus]
MPLAITLHLLAAVIWVGGMFFAYLVLRPVAGQLLEPTLRLTLWTQVFKRFFPWIWLAVLILLITGFWMTFELLGGLARVGMHVHLMMTLGILMMVIFLYICYRPLPRLKQAVEAKNWPQGAHELNLIRKLIGVNLILGILVVCVAGIGRFIQV